MNAQQKCPDVTLLRRLLEGNKIRDAEQLSNHVEECSCCQQALERLASTSWQQRVLEFGPEEPVPPFLEELKAQMMEITPSQDNGVDTEGAAGRALGLENALPQANDLSYLTVSAEVGSLGRLDHYEMLAIIGKGGFGTVFRARDTKLDRLVAIKVLTPFLAASGSARKRFIREAKAAAALETDHVIRIYSVGDAGSVPYLVMELLDRSLQESLDAKYSFDMKEIVGIAMQTAQGLAAAHAHGLVHRDIKPGNILLEEGMRRVKITDFGLVHTDNETSITQSGAITGTPMYMSPEQAEGRAVDHRSDLFSLGSVIYTMCAGEPPFRAPSTPAVLRRVVDDTPPRLHEINPRVPYDLSEIVAKLLEKDPCHRFQTAELLGNALRDVRVYAGKRKRGAKGVKNGSLRIDAAEDIQRPAADYVPAPLANSAGVPPPSTNAEDIKVAVVIDLYLAHMKLRQEAGDIAKRTLDKPKNYLPVFKRDYGNFPVGELGKNTIKNFLLGHQEWISPHTKSDVVGTIMGAFKWAADEPIILKNPLRRPANMPARQPRQPLRRDEVRAIMRAARRCQREEGPGDLRVLHACQSFRLAFWFIWSTGCRPSEMMGASWDDLNWSEGKIELFEHKTARKTGESRIFALDGWQLWILRRLYAVRDLSKPNIFLNGRRQPWKSLAKLFRRFAEAAGISKEKSTYCLRHGVGVELAERGASDREIADILGCTPRMVSWYTRSTRKHVNHLRGINRLRRKKPD